MSIKDLLETHIVVLDTNVLLNTYRYSPEFSEFALECIKAVAEHVVLPATVFLEYSRHYRSAYAEMGKRFLTTVDEPKKQINNAKTKILGSCANLTRLQYPDVDLLESSLSEKMDAVLKVLENYYEDHTSIDLTQHYWNGTDRLNQLVTSLSVMQPLTHDEIYMWCDEGEKRYKKQTPPGYKDAKKDGVRKYSDLFIWKEILRYARAERKDVIFVTDDAKEDWWEINGNDSCFHSQLMDEFNKTGQQIVPMKCCDFFSDVSLAFSIAKTDTVELALTMTDTDYCDRIADRVFDKVVVDLMYNSEDFIIQDSAHIGTEGIDECDITYHEFISAHRVNREEDMVIYEFKYMVRIEGVSYDYWGRDDDTKEIICSDGRDHVFEGPIFVTVERQVESFYDFEDDDSFEAARIVRGEIKELSYSDRLPDPGEYGYCSYCGDPLTESNYAGNGFCINCTRKYDL